jgi:hypothetical protein
MDSNMEGVGWDEKAAAANILCIIGNLPAEVWERNKEQRRCSTTSLTPATAPVPDTDGPRNPYVASVYSAYGASPQQGYPPRRSYNAPHPGQYPPQLPYAAAPPPQQPYGASPLAPRGPYTQRPLTASRHHSRPLKQEFVLHRTLATPPATPEDSGKSSDAAPSPPPSDTYKLLHDPASQLPSYVDEINRQQRILREDVRTRAQLQWFKNVQDTKPSTYYSELAPIGIHILEHGKAAQTSWNVREADFLCGKCEHLEEWLMNGTGDKLFVLRDHDWFKTRPSLTGSEFFKELQAKGTNKTLLLEVQELGKEIGGPNVNAVQPMAIDKILKRWSIRDQSVPPINLLNLMCKDDAYQPWPLAKYCNLLNRAAASSASTAQSAFYATAGKESTEVMTKLIDLEACMHFQIFGQAGAISTWHMDAIGPYTYLTLEPNVEGEPAENVLKLWAYVRTDHLSEVERAEIRLQFKQNHENFKPKPEHIRILALVAGDTLIMPPGTIHAPITISDCLFRGGMVMQKRQMWRSMREWRFCSDNDRCTNENQPRQARSMLDFFKSEVYADPAACGYGGENGVGIMSFEDDYRKLSGACMVCSCKGGCKNRKCGCQLNTQRCGSQCHGGIARCENPYGCEVEKKVEK